MKDYPLNYRRRVPNFPKVQRKAYFYFVVGVLGFWGVREMLDYAM